MTFFISVIRANKIQSSRPPSRDLPVSLTQLKYPFREIPAQKHAGMTEGGHARMTEVEHWGMTEVVHSGTMKEWHAGMSIFISVIPTNKVQSSRPASRDLPVSLTQLK